MEDRLTFNVPGFGNHNSLITKITLSHWGKELIFDCLFEPQYLREPYQLIFRECRKITWEIFNPESANDPESDLIGISMGKEDYQEEAVVHTDCFEVSIAYGSYQINRG